MTDERPVGLADLIEFLSRFEETKTHLILSQREFLLAVRSVIDIIVQAIEARRPEGDPVAQILVIGRSIVDYLIAKLPSSQDAVSRTARLEALRSVLKMLEREEVELRLDAIRAIKRMVESQIEATSKPSGRRVKKVEIE